MSLEDHPETAPGADTTEDEHIDLALAELARQALLEAAELDAALKNEMIPAILMGAPTMSSEASGEPSDTSSSDLDSFLRVLEQLDEAFAATDVIIDETADEFRALHQGLDGAEQDAPATPRRKNVREFPYLRLVQPDRTGEE